MAESNIMKLALIQFQSTLGDVKSSTEHACELIDQAGAAGADMIVLPELFSTGYNLRVIGPRIGELVEPIDGPTVKAMREEAKKNNAYLLAPMALTKTLSGIPYNSSVFIDRSGEIMGMYDKVHLWALERFYFRSGNEFPVFETEFGKVGVMICYDIGFPETARILALKGADLLLCPSAWCVQDMDIWDIDIPARALENTVFVAAVNRFGQEEDDLYMPGHTKICGPRGGVVDQLPDEKEGILYADIDLADVARNRVTSPYLRDRRPEMYDDVKLWS